MLDPIEHMPKAGEVWRHHKTGKTYEIIAIGRDTESGDAVVIYRDNERAPAYGSIWSRPLGNFMGVDGETRKERFFPWNEGRYPGGFFALVPADRSPYHPLYPSLAEVQRALGAWYGDRQAPTPDSDPAGYAVSLQRMSAALEEFGMRRIFGAEWQPDPGRVGAMPRAEES